MNLFKDSCCRSLRASRSAEPRSRRAQFAVNPWVAGSNPARGATLLLLANSASSLNTGSLASGGVYSGFGWDGLNFGVMPLLLLCAGITVWYAMTQRAAARAAA